MMQLETLFDSVFSPSMTFDEWARIGHANGWLGVRNSGTETSRAPLPSLSIRSGSQRATLLTAYGQHRDGLTDEEAGHLSGLAEHPRCCYWKRSSELRQAGYIAPTGTTRLSTAGEAQQVCAITVAGRVALDSLNS